jgi:hypothetical protein
MALPGALLARCPLTAGYILWSVLQTGLLVAAVVMLRAVWGAWAPREQLMCVMTALSLWPAFWSIALGNVSVLILFCMLCAWRLQRAGRCGLAGGALALATGKPQLGLPFLAGQMAARRWRLLGSAGVIVALLTAASVAVIGLRGVLGYTDMVALVAGRTSGYSIHPEKMINLRGLAWVLSGNAALTRGVTWVGWMFALILIWRLWAPAAGASRTPAPREDWRWATTCVLALLASPHLYPHDLCLLLPAGVVLYDRLRGSAAASAAGLALAALNLVWIAVEPLRVAPLLGCAVMAAMLAGLWLVRPDRHTEQTVGCGQSWGECTHERPAITEGAS